MELLQVFSILVVMVDLLKGRGALQDIDQYNVLKSTVKEVFQVTSVRDIASAVENAIYVARSGV